MMLLATGRQLNNDPETIVSLFGPCRAPEQVGFHTESQKTIISECLEDVQKRKSFYERQNGQARIPWFSEKSPKIPEDVSRLIVQFCPDPLLGIQPQVAFRKGTFKHNFEIFERWF